MPLNTEPRSEHSKESSECNEQTGVFHLYYAIADGAAYSRVLSFSDAIDRGEQVSASLESRCVDPRRRGTASSAG
jgi:hypothetical protein